MAWTTPRTWVAAEVVSASLLNAHVRDNENALRDYMLGAQDLGANFVFSAGRSLLFKDTDVAHGITTLFTTDTWGSLAENSATAGGMTFTGLRDDDQLGLVIHGVNGSATPTIAGLGIQASKKNGTATQAFASSEIAMQFYNAGTVLASWYGAGLNVVGGLSVGYSGVPTSGALTVGDASYYLQTSGGGGTAGLYFNATNTYITNTRGVLATEAMTMAVFGGIFLTAKTANTVLGCFGSAVITLASGSVQFNYAQTALGGGAAPTLGTIGGAGPATAGQNSWLKCVDSTGANIFIPCWK